MKKIVLLGKKDAKWAQIFTDTDDMRFVFSSDVMPDAACVLLLPDTADTRLPELVRILRSRRIPFAAVTEDGSDENQERLMDSGAAQVFVLPMSQGLLSKRILSLCSSDGGSEIAFDLFAQLTDKSEQRGAYAVKESDFSNIYRFVQRMQDRAEKQSQLVIFRFTTRLQSAIEPGTLEDAFPIVQKCLRRGDLVCMYGENILAILIGADADGAKFAADRIVNTYQAHFCGSIYDMKYEIREIH